VIAGAILLLATTPAVPAEATHPGPNGRLVFHRFDEAGLPQVWTANPDLTAEHQLTHEDAWSYGPVWAPDASRIAFDSSRSDPDPTDDVPINNVFTMRPDGTEVTKVTDSVGFSGDAAYSPNATLIAFDADRGVDSGDPDPAAGVADLSIFVVNTDGAGMRRITTPPPGQSDNEPPFSPDGTKLVFTRFQDGSLLDSGRVVGNGTSALFTVNLDGTGLHRITGWGLKAGQADWSPDGSRNVFEIACCRLGAGGVYTVRADGSGFAAVVDGHGVTGIGNEQALQVDGYYDPVWSPDGTKILAGHEFFGDDGTFRVGLVQVNPDGSDLHWAATEVHEEHQPDWGPRTNPVTANPGELRSVGFWPIPAMTSDGTPEQPSASTSDGTASRSCRDPVRRTIRDSWGSGCAVLPLDTGRTLMPRSARSCR
jgi:Tol biopolymer transport system component